MSLLACVTGCAAESVGEADGDEELAGEPSALIVAAPTQLEASTPPVAIHAPAIGLSGTEYGAEWSRLTAVGFTPVSLTGYTFPDGSVRFSSVFHKNRDLTAFSSWRSLSQADYYVKMGDFSKRGYRALDVVAHAGSSGMVYDAIWVQDASPKQWSAVADQRAAGLQSALAAQQAAGLRPIRLHGYRNGTTTLYSATFVKDELGTDYRVVLDQTGRNYGVEFDRNVADGYRPVDVSAYPVGNEVRYAGIFVKDPSLTGSFAFRDMTLADLRAKQQQYAEANYVMVDAESYSTSTSSTTIRYAAIWQRRQNLNVTASFSLSTQSVARFSAAARTALTRLRSSLAGYGANAGFLVEDLNSGRWLGYRVNEPFYMASTYKVLIAAAVLDQVDAGTLALATSVQVDAADIEETNDQPTAPRMYTVRQLLGWMLNDSSTNATDRLVRLVGAPAINRFLEDNGILDVGEITSICELDRRILLQQNACAATLPCRELERWFRNGQNPPAGAMRNCTDRLTRNDDASYEAYYATLANSITPLQMGRFWRRVLDAQAISAPMRDTLVDILAPNGAGELTVLPGTFFDEAAVKGGGKREVDCSVGLGFDVNGASPGAVDDTARYAFGIYTEDYQESAANNATAVTLKNAIARDALTVLQGWAP